MNVLKYVILFTGILLLFSCAKKEEVKAPEDKIEIYLTHHEILPENCIPLLEYDLFWEYRFKDVPKEDYKEIIKYVRNYKADTITKEMGRLKHKFIATKNDLELSPIIFNKEIKSFNLEKSIIEIDSFARKRITSRLSYLSGKQFAITYKEEVIFTGYFESPFSSTQIKWYTFDLLSLGGYENIKHNTNNLQLRKCYCYKDSITP